MGRPVPMFIQTLPSQIIATGTEERVRLSKTNFLPSARLQNEYTYSQGPLAVYELSNFHNIQSVQTHNNNYNFQWLVARRPDRVRKRASDRVIYIIPI